MRSLKIIFMGTPAFATTNLHNLILNNFNIQAVVTAPDKKSGRGQKIHYSEVKKYCINKNLDLLQPIILKDENFINKLKSYEADLFIVVAFRMLPELVWRIPKKGTINLHASLLPQLRGAAPIQWAIIHGLKKTGLTTFFINKDIDTGDIIDSRTVEINDHENSGDLYKKLEKTGGILLISTIKKIKRNKFNTINQTSENENLLLAPKLSRENTRIDWNKSGKDIHNLIRGLNPKPSAWTKSKVDDKIIKIHNTIFHKSKLKNNIIGQIIFSKNVLKIMLIDGYLEVLELQIEGKKSMKGVDFINGYKSYESQILF